MMPVMDVTFASVLADITSFVTAAVSWMGLFMDFIMSNALLTCFVVTPLIGLGVGLLMRLIRG